MADFLGAGLRSFAELPDSAARGGALNLHLNQLRTTEGIERFEELDELILSANAIQEIHGLERFSRLRVLDVSSNALRRLSGLAGLVGLERLHAAYNRLQSLEGLRQLWGRRRRLRALDLRQNQVSGLPQLLFLGGCTRLQELRLQDAPGRASNPICSEADYRFAVMQAVPWLQSLDNEAVSPRERVRTRAGGMVPAVPVERPAEEPLQTEPVHVELPHVDAETADVEPLSTGLLHEPPHMGPSHVGPPYAEPPLAEPLHAELLLRAGPHAEGPTEQLLDPVLEAAEPLMELTESSAESPEPAELLLAAEPSAVEEQPMMVEPLGHGRGEAELLELARRMASMAQELSPPPAEALRRLQGEVLSELSALRTAEGSTRRQEEEAQAEELREMGLRADLAELAAHTQRREEKRLAAERELERVAAAVTVVGEARAREAEALEAEELRHAELEAELGVQEREEAVARAAELSTRRALRSAEAGEAAASELPLLRRELQRTRTGLQGARQRLLSQEAVLPPLEAGLAEAEVRRETAGAALGALCAEATARGAEAGVWGREAAEEAAALAAGASRAAAQLRQRHCALAAEAASALKCREGLERVAVEAAGSEQEVAELTSEGAVRELSQELRHERARAESQLNARGQRCTQLRQRLQAALDSAEEAVAGGRQRLGLEEQRLARQREAARLADEQDGLARYILAELSLEVEQAKASACERGSEADVLVECEAREAKAAREAQGTATTIRGRAEGVARSITEEHVPLALHQRSVARGRELRAAASLLAEHGCEGREALAAGAAQLDAWRRELAELEEALQSARRRELEVGQNIRLKHHMAADKRDHMEAVRLAMRRAEASQKEAHRALHSRLTEASAQADEQREWAEQLGNLLEEECSEHCRWQRDVERKDEMVRFTEEQLLQLREAQGQREEHARAQARFVQSEESRLLDEARGHAEEMERRFRKERLEQDQARSARSVELAELRRQLLELPQALQAASRSMAEERAAAARRVAALLVGLQG